MKKNLGLLFLLLFVVFSSFGQTAVTVKDTITKRYQSNIKYPSPKVVDQAAAAKYVVDWVSGLVSAKADTASVSNKVAHASSTALRLGLVGTPNVVILYDKGGYTFRYDVTNSMVDDSAMIISVGSLRYVRVTNHLEPEFWGAKGDSITNDTQPWQKCVNFYRLFSRELPIVFSGRYTITSTIHYETNQVVGRGLKMIGGGSTTTGFYTKNINGPLFYIDGNDDNVPNNTTFKQARGMVLRDFFVTRYSVSSTGTTTGIMFSSQTAFHIKDLQLRLLSGDGIRITANGYGDYGESGNGLIENTVCEGIAGTGFNFKSETDYLGGNIRLLRSRAIFCGVGIFAELCDQLDIEGCQVVANYVRGIWIGANVGTMRLLRIKDCELGNVNTESSIRIDGVVNAIITQNRFVNNAGENTAKQIILGKEDGSGTVSTVLIERNTIIQAESTFSTSQHYQYFINPGVANLTIRDDVWSIFLSGTKYNDKSRINTLLEHDPYTGVRVEDRPGAVYTEYINAPTTSSLTPDPVRNYRVNFQANANFTLQNPTAPYQENDEFSVGIWNTLGPTLTATLSLGNAYNSPGTITIPTGAYQGYILHFKYLGGYWWVIK